MQYLARGVIDPAPILIIQDANAKIEHEMIYCVYVSQAIRPELYKQAHAITQLLYHNWRGTAFKSYDSFRQALSIELGYTDVKVIRKDKGVYDTIMIAKSWSYSTPFEKWHKGLYKKLMPFACDYFKTDMDSLIQMSIEHKMNNK